MSDRLRDLDGLAEYLGLNPVTVARKVKSGEWPGRKIGRAYRFTDDDVQAILDICYVPANSGDVA